MDQAWIDREKHNCDPYRKLTKEDLEEIDKVGDLTVINPPKSWKGPLSLSELGIPNWKFLIYDALKDSLWPAWTFDRWENDFEDNEYVYNMICGLEYSYKNYHNKYHPFSLEYEKITDFLHRAEGKQFIIN
jgi:hypothetical protein